MFKSAGIDVTIKVLQNSGAMDSAVSSGAIDIAASSVAVVANASQRGLPLRFIGTGCVYTSGSPPTSEIVVAKHSPLQSVADPNRKVVAVNGLKDITQIAVQTWLDKNGADLSSIKFVEIRFGAMTLALGDRRVVAANLPNSYMPREKEKVRVLANAQGAVSDHYLIIGWIATKSWLKKKNSQSGLSAFWRSQGAWGNGHLKESARILSPYLKISPEEIQSVTRAVFADHPRMSPNFVQQVIQSCSEVRCPRALDAGCEPDLAGRIGRCWHRDRSGS